MINIIFGWIVFNIAILIAILIYYKYLIGGNNNGKI